MDLVKKNLFSIICGVVALLAIVAIFWPINGYYAELRKTASDREGVYRSIKGILGKPRALPTVAVTPTAEPGKLDQFPTKAVIEAWKGATDKIKAESAEILTAVIEMNKHDLLVPGSLPGGSDSNALISFRDLYRPEMDFTTPEARALSMPVRILKAGFLPTEAQIAERRRKETVNFDQAFGASANDPALQTEKKNRLERVPELMRIEVADESKIYMDPTGTHEPYGPVFDIKGGTPEPSMIFVAQVGYWVQQDVMQALAAANKDAKNVREAAIKHLLKFKFVTDLRSFTAPPPAGAQAGDPAVWPQPKYEVSVTGRTSNPVYDVIKFDLTVYADAEQIPRILQEMSRGRLITVLNCGIQTIDSGAQKARGYDYGDKSIVQLDMNCEALLLRQWTKPLMPPQVRTALSIPPDQPK